MPMVFHASQTHYNFRHNVICNLIKIPTTSYVNATLKRWGHDFLRIRGGRGIQTSEAMGKNQLSKGKPIKTVNYPFLVFFPNHLFILEIG